MVKVLENKLVDLDIVPGQEQIDLQRKFREQMRSAKGIAGQMGDSNEVELPEGAQAVEGQEGAEIANQQGFQIPKEMLPQNLSDEQKSRARGFGGVIIDSSGKVISGLAGTVGGVLKGVGDTAGNTVYGLGKTGTGLVSGLADTAKAPFTGLSPTAAAEPNAEDTEAQSGAESAAGAAARRKPRKIELRSGGAESAANPEVVGEIVEH